jgi:hypothetical protein
MLKTYVWIGAVLAAGCVSQSGFASAMDVWSEPFRVEKIEASGINLEFTVSNPNVANHEKVSAACTKTRSERKFYFLSAGAHPAYLSLLMSSLNLNHKLRLRYSNIAVCSPGKVSGFDALELSL